MTQIIRRPLYSLIYNNFFKQQNYEIDLVLTMQKAYRLLARRKKLNKIKIIENKENS